MSKPRVWRRWVSMTLEQTIRSLCQMARRHGLQIISANRPGFCMWEGLAFWGTGEQMRALEGEWKALGLTVKNRMPRGAWGVNYQLPRARWAEVTINWKEEDGQLRSARSE